MENREEYQALYAEFIRGYQTGSVTGEQVGELIVRLAGYYPYFNQQMVSAERAFAMIARDNMMQTDDTTGKSISAVKAQTFSDATDEAYAYKVAKTHIENLEMLIQSAKALQRGLLQEAVHANN
jgi:hypothetical protein